MEAIKGMSIWALWFSFSGRINRETFWLKGILLGWLAFLGCIAVGLLISFLISLLSEAVGLIAWYVEIVPLTLGFLVSQYAVCVKRLHDRNRPGWWAFATLIPIAGLFIGIWLFVELGFLKGDSGPNRYGDVPSNI